MTTRAPSKYIPFSTFPAFITCLAQIWAIGFAGSLSANAQVSVLTYHNDNARTGQNTNETILTLANVNQGGFGLVCSRPVDDWVYAQPLVMANVNIPGNGTHNVLLVATVNDTLYAFDADDSSRAAPYWQTNFLVPPAVPPRNTDMTGACGGNYQDFHGNMGIVGTPVIDPASGTLYVVVRTKEAGNTFVQRLRALDVATGLERAYSPVILNASYQGTTFDSQKQGQRPGLALANGVIYNTSASHCDWGPYHGWVLSYAATNLQRLAVYNTTPSGGLGGIWQGGCPPAIDSSGTLFFATGNGTFSTPSSNNNSNNFGDSILRIATTNGLTVADYFTPWNQSDLENRDADLGSGAAILLPDAVGSSAHPHLLVQAGKEGKIYLVDRDNMGHNRPSDDTQIVQSIPNAIGGAFDTPAYFNKAFYYVGSGDVMKAFQITNGAIYATPLSQSPSGYGFPGATPSVSANGTNNAIVWALDNGAWGSGGPAILHAYNATNLALELYNSAQAGARDRLAGAVKFSVPTVANGKVYVGGQYALSVLSLATFLSAPTISPNGGVFTNSLSVSLADSTPGAGIRYTLDSTTPTTSSTLYAAPFLLTNSTVVKAKAFKAGSVESSVATATFVESRSLGTGVGLAGNYWSNQLMTFTGPPTLTRIDPTVNFDWGTGSPDPTISVDLFTARWTGDVQPLFSETYTFYTRTDDGVRLWVNNQLVIDAWFDQAPTEWSGVINLVAGGRYSIQMDYYENGGGAVAQLSWSGPSTSKQIIPTSQLYPVHNSPPYAYLDTPINGASFTAPATLTLSATAGDPDGTVVKVDYFSRTTLLGTATQPPYYLTVPGLDVGTYPLVARATDNGGLTFTTGPSTITVTAGSGVPYGLAARAPAPAFLNLPAAFAGAMPTNLSQTGAFADTRNLAPAGGLVPYSVIVPFWSDAAVKTRWLMVPNNGTNYTADEQIGFAPAGEWTFPAGTVFVQHFELATNDANPNLKRRLETRFIVRDTNNGVYGVTYKWRPDNSDADLLTTSLSENISITTASGTRTQAWYYPSPSDCLACHTPVSGGVLGVKTRQLNGNFTYPSTAQTDNQIRAFNRLGLLLPAINEAGIAGYAHLSALTNLSASLEERSRSYLDANCAQCHRPGGVVHANFDARYDTALANQGLINGPVVNGLGLDNARVVAPKDIWRSVLYDRMYSLDAAIRMPPLARNLYDTNAVQVIANWINSLPGTPALAPPAIQPNGGSFVRSISVSLQHPDPSATLRYTLDNSLPTTNSTLFSGPLTLTNSATLRAKAFETGFVDSAAASAAFFIRPPLFFTAGGHFTNGQFQLQLSGLAGKSYLFEASTNFLNWLPLSTNLASSNLFYLLDPGASNFPYRFYRAIELP